jgi:hypothetical protein
VTPAWSATIALCAALLAIGAIIDEYYVPEKHKDWVREKAKVFDLKLQLEAYREELHNSEVPLYSGAKLFPRELFFDKYFLGGCFVIFCLSMEAIPRLMQRWSVGLHPAISFWWAVVNILAFFYTVFVFRWVNYKAKPGAGRLVTFLVLLPMFCVGSVYVAGWQFDGGTSDVLAFCFAVLVISTTMALGVAAVFVLPIMIAKPMNYTVSQVLRAAARPDKPPYKFLAVVLSALIGLGKTLFDLISAR